MSDHKVVRRWNASTLQEYEKSFKVIMDLVEFDDSKFDTCGPNVLNADVEVDRRNGYGNQVPASAVMSGSCYYKAVIGDIPPDWRKDIRQEIKAEPECVCGSFDLFNNGCPSCHGGKCRSK